MNDQQTQSAQRGARSAPPHGSAIDGLNGQLMVMAAHRYCLGRQSYIVGSCIEWLRLWWPKFERNTRNVIVRDTVEALQDNCAGSDFDAREWKSLAEWAWEQMDAESQTWCKQAVAHRNQPWPLSPNEKLTDSRP